MFSSLTSWLGRPARTPRTRSHRPRLAVDRLEDRTVPAAGSLDPTFGQGGSVFYDVLGVGQDEAQDLVIVQPDEKILVVGRSNSLTAVIRYNSDGSVDDTFGTSGQALHAFGSSSFAQAVTADYFGTPVSNPNYGKLYVAGSFGVARLNADGSQDASFDGDGQASVGFTCTSVAVQSDGRIVIGGSTDLGNAFAVARLNADGTLDSTFDSDGKVTIDFGPFQDFANSVALDYSGSPAINPNYGKLYIAGSTYQGGSTQTDFAVARLNADGSLDNSFSDDGKLIIDFATSHDNANSVAVQSDGKVVLGGGCDSFSTGPDFAAVRLNVNGSLDGSFGFMGKTTVNFGFSSFGGSSDFAQTMALQTDGRIVLAGASNGDFAVARLTSSGNLDPSLNAGDSMGLSVVTVDFGSTDIARGVAVQADGRIMLAGYSNLTAADSDIAVARLTANGSLDTTFSGDGKVTTDIPGSSDNWANAMATAPDGKIVTLMSASVDFVVVRHRADGSLDTNFGDGGQLSLEQATVGYLTSVAVQADGKIVLIGGSYPGIAVMRLNTDGSPDTTFGSDGKATIDFGSSYGFGSRVAVQADGKIVVAGDLYLGGSGYDFAVARLNANGSPDTSFGSGGKATVDFGSLTDQAIGVTVQSDGRIVIAGNSFQGGSNGDDFAVARLNANGTLDSTFNGDGKATVDFGSTDEQAFGVAVRDDQILVVGYSNQGGGTGYDFAATRLNVNGTLDSTFDGDGKATVDFGASDDYGYSAAVQSDGRIVVAGYSSQGSTGGDVALARLNANGTLDSTFDGDGRVLTDFGPDDGAQCLDLQADGTIVIAGWSSQGTHAYDTLLARYEGYALSVAGTAGDDTITIESGTQAGTLKTTINELVTDNIVVDGEAFVAGLGGNDTYTVRFGNLPGLVLIADTAGTDTLTVHGTTAGDDLDISGTGYTMWRPVGAPTYQQRVEFSGIEQVTLNAGAGDDVVHDPESANLLILGGDGNDTIVVAETAGLVTVDGGNGSDTYVIQTANLQGAVTVTDTGTTGTNAVTIVGSAGSDIVTQDGNQVVVNGEPITITGSISTLTIDGGGGTGDTFTVLSTPTVTATVQGVSDVTVQGTSGPDVIQFSKSGTTVVAKLNGGVVGTFPLAGVNRLVAHGAGGDDDIEVSGSLGIPAWLFGEVGHDRLKGGASNDVLLGGSGDDLIVGGDGRDLLTGGFGSDRLVGNAEDDILIAGSTTFDGNEAALSALKAEWCSGRSYSQRIANLSNQSIAGTDGSQFEQRANGGCFLTTGVNSTVLDDNIADVLTGSSGQDWFLFNADGEEGTAKDKVTDLSASEFADDLDWIDNGF